MVKEEGYHEGGRRPEYGTEDPKEIADGNSLGKKSGCRWTHRQGGWGEHRGIMETGRGETGSQTRLD